MRAFACLLDPLGRDIPESHRQAYEIMPRRHGLMMEWQALPGAAVLCAWDDPYGDPLLVRDGEDVAIGVARLDNRRDLEKTADIGANHFTDLEVVLRAIMRQGATCIAHILGDFAFVLWNACTRRAIAACDGLMVKKLYYTESHGVFAFADRAAFLARQQPYDVQYLAERVAGSEVSPSLSAFEGIKIVPAGSLILLDRGKLVRREYWAPGDACSHPSSAISADEAAATFRDLLTEAVRCRLSPDGNTWAQLSGGLDSSSVACVAQWLGDQGLVAHGLSGTVTYVDRQATASDEREYSDLVVHRWRLRNEEVVDPPVWYDERYPPPQLDQPRLSFMFYPREYRLCEMVRGAGARVLLTGQGPDEYLRGSMFFFADWIARGRIWPALSEMARRAAIGRVSFWSLAYRNALMPLLPRPLQKRFGPEVTQLAPWVHPTIARQFDLRSRNYELSLNAGPPGEKYRTTTLKGVQALRGSIGHLILDDSLDVRHPFLDRRLVEFGLRLLPEFTTQPYAGKWVLREAMRGLLPERVRTRVGKGTQIERHAWSLVAQRALLAPLVEEPILADLGVVDGGKLRVAFDEALSQPQRKGDPHAAMQQVLAIEAWLQIRAGRWPRGAA